MKRLWLLLLGAIACFTGHIEGQVSPIQHLNFSLWSEYKRDNFEELTQDEKREKLKKIFEDQVIFIEKHKIRRFIVKILDPLAFDFFHPDNFDLDSDDNFLFWAVKLKEVTQIEALFDKNTFQMLSLIHI